MRTRDPGGLVILRSLRAAIVIPSAFALTHLLFANPQVGLFGAFGSFALLLLVDFPGRPRLRLVSYLVLFVVGGVLVTVGTVASSHKLAAVAAMAVVGFVVLFAGIASPQAATASTAALLVFVLPVAVAEPAAAVGPRLLGWLIAGALGLPAVMLLWPRPWHDDIRRQLSATMSAIAGVAAARAEGRSEVAAQASVTTELAQLRTQFAQTPYPPAGSAGGTVALAKLVGRVEWLAGMATLGRDGTGSRAEPPFQAIAAGVAETLQLTASLTCNAGAHPVDDASLISAVGDSTRRLDGLIAGEIDDEVSTLIASDGAAGGPPTVTTGDVSDDGGSDDEGDRDGIASALDPSFHIRSVGTATTLVVDAALEASGAKAVDNRLLGRAGMDASQLLWPRLRSHLSLRSVWFRNAVRGAAGLALAVAVVEITDVEHGFWVVLGTLSVLRSNALGTSSTAVRAMAGTAVGFVVGSVIMIGVAGHLVLLWVLLPLAVAVSGVAPTMISFAAGQAGFTVVVIIVFNIIVPSGWQVGLTRIEDVAIGCAVSVVVGVLFWPRGATAALGRALSDSFVLNSGYLADAVNRLTISAHVVDTGPAARAAQSAYLRLDDAFRQLLAERRVKVVPVETVTSLFTGTNRIRLAAYTLASLPAAPLAPGQSELESVAVAGAVLRDAYAASHRWYEEFAEMLADRRQALDRPPDHDATLHDVLRRAFDEARARRRGDRVRTVLQMLWADQLLESQGQVQTDLARSATLFAARHHADGHG